MAWTAAILVISAFAVWRGGRVERVVAVANLLAWLATMAVQDRLRWVDPAAWVDPQWGVLGVDIAFALLLLVLAARVGRNWLLFAAAFQILGVVTHIAMMADSAFLAKTYLAGLIFWSYGVLAALGVGTWIEWRRRQGQAP
jgi:hypothetical protein